MKKSLRTLSLIALMGFMVACNNATTSSISSSVNSNSSSTVVSSDVQSSSDVESSSSVEESQSSSEEESSSEELSSSTIESSSSEESSSTEESSSETIVEATGVTLNKETTTLEITKDVANPTETLVATVAPENTTDKSVVWSSSDEAVVTVENGLITGLKVGTAVVTVTKGTFTAECNVTVKTKLPEIEDKSIATLTDADLDQSKLIRLTGVVTNIVNTTFGNFDLVDPTTGNSVYVYGLGSAETKDTSFSWKESVLSYSNPRDFKDLNVEEGDVVTVVGTYFLYTKTNVKEFSGYLESEGDRNQYKYTASVTVDETKGTASLSKTSDITYGEEITVIVTPNTGYKVESVKVNDVALTEQEGVYKFNASVRNEVVVTFMDADVTATSFALTVDNMNLNTGYPSEDVVASFTDKGATVEFTYNKIMNGSNTIQMQGNSKGEGYLYNTSAFPLEIESVTIFANDAKFTNSKTVTSFYFGTSALSADLDTAAGTFGLANKSADGYTIPCNVEGATFFRLHNKSGAAYYDSIVINFKAQ